MYFIIWHYKNLILTKIDHQIYIIVIYHFKHVPQFVSLLLKQKNDWIWPLSLCYKYCNITTMSMLLFGLNVRGARLTNMRKKRKQARLDLVLCTNKQLDLRSLFFAWISQRYWKNLLPWPERAAIRFMALFNEN